MNARLLLIAALALPALSRAQTSGIIGVEGVAAYNGLTPADKDALRAKAVLFYHASVGGNVVGLDTVTGGPTQSLPGGTLTGTRAEGLIFWPYYDAATPLLGLLETSYGDLNVNGYPYAKLLGFDKAIRLGYDAGVSVGSASVSPALIQDPKSGPIVRGIVGAGVIGPDAIGSRVQLIGAKLGWADFPSLDPSVRSTGADMDKLWSEYVDVIERIREDFRNRPAPLGALRIFHVTPPLMIGAPARDNALRLDFGRRLKAAYGSRDVVFDLAAIESTDATGQTCLDAGLPTLCSIWAADVTPNTAPDQDSHLNPNGATRAAKAFIYALHRATQGL